MADKRFGEFPPVTEPTDTAVVVVLQGGATKQQTLAQILGLHTGLADPHPQYLTLAEASALFAPLAGAPGGGTLVPPSVLSLPFFADVSDVVGDTGTLTPGAYTGNPAPTVTRVWKRNGSPIAGATGEQLTWLAEGVYTVTETATNSQGSISRDSSNSVTVTPVPALPGAVQSLAAGAVNSVSQVLTFAPPTSGYPTNFTYVIRRRLNSAGGAYGDPVTATALPVTIGGLSASTAYDYEVRAVNLQGEGAPAVLLNLSTTAAPSGSTPVGALLLNSDPILLNADTLVIA